MDHPPAPASPEPTTSGEPPPVKARKAAPAAPPPTEDAAPAAETTPDLAAMQARGLVHDGKHSLRLPGSHIALPARNLDGPTAARYIPDEPTLLWVLGQGYSIPAETE